MSIKEKNARKAFDNVLNVVECEQNRKFALTSDLFNDFIDAFASKLGNVSVIPTNVSPDYTGIHLSQSYRDDDFKSMINLFKKQQKLDPFYALKILIDSRGLLSKLPNINEFSVESPGCIIVGDLHGSFKDLFYLIDKYDIPGKRYVFLFNGDYIGNLNIINIIAVQVVYSGHFWMASNWLSFNRCPDYTVFGFKCKFKYKLS